MDVLPSLIVSLLELVCIFIAEMASEIGKHLSNVYLVMSSFDGWTIAGFRTFNFSNLYSRFEHIVDYCLSNLPGKPEFIIEWWTWLVKKVR